jgi:hypothetical protein
MCSRYAFCIIWHVPLEALGCFLLLLLIDNLKIKIREKGGKEWTIETYATLGTRHRMMTNKTLHRMLKR